MGEPLCQVVPVGEALWHVHELGRGAVEFNPTARPAPAPGEPVLGGRFDSVDGSYAYWYAGRSEPAVFAESFARHLDYTQAGPRPLSYLEVAGQAVSDVRTARELNLVVAYGAGAEQLGQDIWLTTADEDDYPLTRQWATAVRLWVPESDGLVWKSRRDPAEEVLVLWGDPRTAKAGCGLVALGPGPVTTEPLASGPAWLRLKGWLEHWRLYIDPAH